MSPDYIKLQSEKWDVDGVLVLTERFRNAVCIEQLDLLQDWIATLEALYSCINNSERNRSGKGENDIVSGTAKIVLNSNGELFEDCKRKVTKIWTVKD